MMHRLRHWLLVHGLRPPRSDHDRSDLKLARDIETAIGYAAKVPGGGIERFVIAGEMMIMDGLVHSASVRTSDYVIAGATIQASRMLAVQDMSKLVRAEHGYEVAKEFRARVMALPIMLLLTQDAIHAVNKRLAR